MAKAPEVVPGSIPAASEGFFFPLGHNVVGRSLPRLNKFAWFQKSSQKTFPAILSKSK